MCRTRVIGSIFPETDGIVFGRGNLSFTSINLPRIGLKHGIALNERETADWDGFYAELREKFDLCVNQLMERFNIQSKKKVKNFPFLMGQGVWTGSDKLDMNDHIGDIAKHGTLSLGFISVAETLKAMMGVHHGESEEAQNRGLEIVGTLRRWCDESSQELQMNVTLLATPKMLGH